MTAPLFLCTACLHSFWLHSAVGPACRNGARPGGVYPCACPGFQGERPPPFTGRAANDNCSRCGGNMVYEYTDPKTGRVSEHTCSCVNQHGMNPEHYL